VRICSSIVPSPILHIYLYFRYLDFYFTHTELIVVISPFTKTYFKEDEAHIYLHNNNDNVLLSFSEQSHAHQVLWRKQHGVLSF